LTLNRKPETHAFRRDLQELDGDGAVGLGVGAALRGACRLTPAAPRHLDDSGVRFGGIKVWKRGFDGVRR